MGVAGSIPVGGSWLTFLNYSQTHHKECGRSCSAPGFGLRPGYLRERRVQEHRLGRRTQSNSFDLRHLGTHEAREAWMDTT